MLKSKVSHKLPPDAFLQRIGRRTDQPLHRGQGGSLNRQTDREAVQGQRPKLGNDTKDKEVSNDAESIVMFWFAPIHQNENLPYKLNQKAMANLFFM
jgi:hypothetical protein